jgi:hypothetical protein
VIAIDRRQAAATDDKRQHCDNGNKLRARRRNSRSRQRNSSKFRNNEGTKSAYSFNLSNKKLSSWSQGKPWSVTRCSGWSARPAELLMEHLQQLMINTREITWASL